MATVTIFTTAIGGRKKKSDWKKRDWWPLRHDSVSTLLVAHSDQKHVTPVIGSNEQGQQLLMPVLMCEINVPTLRARWKLFTPGCLDCLVHWARAYFAGAGVECISAIFWCYFCLWAGRSPSSLFASLFFRSSSPCWFHGYADGVIDGSFTLCVNLAE